MKLDPQSFFKMFGTLALATVSLVPAASAQTAEEKSSGKGDQWIHVRVVSREDKGETVRVNVPIEMAEKVIPAINKDNLRNGRLHIDNAHMDEVDFRALLDAVRTAKDGQYVTVQSHENNVKVEKKAGYLYIYVTDKEAAKKAAKDDSTKAASGNESKVEIKLPMKVVDALFSSGKDELDLVAALKALSANGDVELVSVKDSENTVRVWIDSKNVSD
jgi:hypothetical protein